MVIIHILYCLAYACVLSLMGELKYNYALKDDKCMSTKASIYFSVYFEEDIYQTHKKNPVQIRSHDFKRRLLKN